MGMSYGARNALTFGFYADIESPEEFATRNGARADTAAFAASSIATEFACDFALTVATGGVAGAVKGATTAAKAARTVARAWQATSYASDIVHSVRGVANYTQSGDATHLIAAAAHVGGSATGRLFSSAGRKARKAGETQQQTGPGGCFVAGTLVVVEGEDGEQSTKPIEEIEVGDKVLSKSDETGEQGFKPVVRLFKTRPTALYHLTYRRTGRAKGSAYRGVKASRESAHSDDDPPLTVTGTVEHPFWSLTRDGWVPMSELKAGERLLLADGEEAVVTGLEVETLESTDDEAAKARGHFWTYNFEVADWHTYYIAEALGGEEEDAVWVHNQCRKIAAEEFSALTDEFSRSVTRRNFKKWKKGLLKRGYRTDTIQDIIEHGSIKKGYNIWGDSWTRYYSEITGTKRPPGVVRPHGHHLVQKKGGGAAGIANRQILDEVGINPLLSRHNLGWAPNIVGQHGKASQGQLLEMLMPARGNREAIKRILDDWRVISATR